MPFIFGRFAIAPLSAAAVAFSAFAAHAADVPPDPASAVPSISVMVVDSQRVMQQSKAGKIIQTQVKQRADTYQKGIAKQEAELSAAQQDLQKQQAILAQDAFAAKVKEFEGRFGEARRKAQQSQQELVQGENEARGKELVALRQILEDLARERHANLVLDRAAVMIFDEHFDVTEEVIKRLDQKMPTLTVSFPDLSQAQASAPAAPGAQSAPAAPAAPNTKKAPPKKPN